MKSSGCLLLISILFKELYRNMGLRPSVSGMQKYYLLKHKRHFYGNIFCIKFILCNTTNYSRIKNICKAISGYNCMGKAPK